MTVAAVVCTCRVPLTAGTGRFIEIDRVLVPNQPPVCVRCYLRGRDAQPSRMAAPGDATGAP